MPEGSAIRLVSATGDLVEVVEQDLAQEVMTLRDHIRELERTIRRQSRELGDLKRDREREARENTLWPVAVKLHSYYNKVTGRKSQWRLDGFEMCESFLKTYGFEVCCAAIDGIALDHYVTTRANGTKRHHWGWNVLFRDTERFQEAVNSAPIGVLKKLSEEGLLPGMTPKKAKGDTAQLPLEETA